MLLELDIDKFWLLYVGGVQDSPLTRVALVKAEPNTITGIENRNYKRLIQNVGRTFCQVLPESSQHSNSFTSFSNKILNRCLPR